MASTKTTTMRFFLLVCIIGLCHCSCKLLYKDCGSKAGTLSQLMFNATCSSGKAILKKGTAVSIAFSFKTKSNEAELSSKVQGKIGVLPFVDFPLDNPDACKDSGLKCPVTANTAVVYQPTLFVKEVYPKVNVIVKWQLLNKSGDNVFCALIPAVITA